VRSGWAPVWQVAGVEVEFGVPAGDLVDPSGKVSEVVECLPATAEEIEPHRAHPGAGEGLNLPGRGRGWELGDADETGPETVKGIEQVGLVETLEGARHDRATYDVQMLRPAAVVLHGEGRR